MIKFAEDQVWVPEEHYKGIGGGGEIDARTIYEISSRGWVRYGEPIDCPCCDAMIRRDGSGSMTVDDFTLWVKESNAKLRKVTE